MESVLSMGRKNFNPRSRVGNDKLKAVSIYLTTHFNPRSRVGNDADTPPILKANGEFQSTFPRGERHCKFSGITPMIQFQSTFPRGERRSEPATRSVRKYFNPRSRVGNDDTLRSGVLFRKGISIHVPAWGTTPVRFRKDRT